MGAGILGLDARYKGYNTVRGAELGTQNTQWTTAVGTGDEWLLGGAAWGARDPLLSYPIPANGREVVIIHGPTTWTRGGQSPVRGQADLDVA